MTKSKENEQRTHKNKKNLKRRKIGFFVLVLLGLIVGPIILSFIFDLPKIWTKIPFDSDVWFTFWVSYFSLISTIILDCVALFFAYYTYEKEEAYKKNDFLYINNAAIKLFKQGVENLTPVYLLKFFLIDRSPALTFRQDVNVLKFDLYVVTNEQFSINPQLLHNNCALSLNSKLLYSYDYNYKDYPFNCRATNSQYVLELEFCTNNDIIEELYISNHNSDDKKNLYVVMTYKISSSHLLLGEKFQKVFKKTFDNNPKEFTTHLLLSRLNLEDDGNCIQYETVYENQKG